MKLVESISDEIVPKILVENKINENVAETAKKRKLSNDTCLSDEIQNENQVKKKKINKWSNKEILCLVYLVNRVGRLWVDILSSYEQYFENRTAQDLCNKYVKLERDPLVLDQFKRDAELLLKDEIKEFSKKTVTGKYDKWEDDEVVCLIRGVNMYGRNWVSILNEYKNKFKKHRDTKGLHSKYKYLENNQDSFDYFKKMAGIE